MDKQFSLEGEKFQMSLTSDKPFDTNGEIPTEEGTFETQLFGILHLTGSSKYDKENDIHTAKMQISADDASFTLEMELVGWEKIPLKDLLKNKGMQVPGFSLTYRIEGDACLIPFATEFVNQRFWQARLSGSYAEVLPFLSSAKQQVKNPKEIDLITPLLEEQKKFLESLPPSIDKEVIPILEACSGYAWTNDSCAGGFNLLLDGEKESALWRRRISHTPQELMATKQKLGFASGYLIPGEIVISGQTDTKGIAAFDRAYRKLKKEYHAFNEHPIDCSIPTFGFGIRIQKSRAKITEAELTTDYVEKLYAPYPIAREKMARLLEKYAPNK
jgi:hypothetical protein